MLSRPQVSKIRKTELRMMRRVTDQKSTTRMPGADRQMYEARLLRVLSYIYDHLDGDLSLDAVADVARMSPHHWHRVFRAMTGETLAATIRRVRLLKAADALASEDAPVGDIAERFGSPKSPASPRLQRPYGKPPGAFRDQSGERAATLCHSTGDHPMYPVVIQNLAASRAAGVLHLGPYQGLGLAFQKLGAAIAARNLFSHVEGMIAVYHDAPGSKPDTDLHAHAAVITATGFPPDIDGLEYFDLVGGKHAIMRTTALTRRWAARTNGCTAHGCRSPAKSRGTRRRSNCTSMIPAPRRRINCARTCACRWRERHAQGARVRADRGRLAHPGGLRDSLALLTGPDHNVYDEPRPVPDTHAAETPSIAGSRNRLRARLPAAPQAIAQRSCGACARTWTRPERRRALSQPSRRSMPAACLASG